ncbi:MAG: hypothetical protein AAGF46_08585 [Pseudomonadota bacterium]
MHSTDADRIWNRAALEGGGTDPKAGDLAPAAMLLAHGLIMNGGVHHAVECLTPEETANAIEGFRYFGLSAIGDILLAISDGHLSPCTDATEYLANTGYHQHVPDDNELARRFKAMLYDHPDQFARVAA